jgi:hypothetical protein
MLVTLYFFFSFLVTGSLNFIGLIIVLRGMVAAGAKVSCFEIR